MAAFTPIFTKFFDVILTRTIVSHYTSQNLTWPARAVLKICMKKKRKWWLSVWCLHLATHEFICGCEVSSQYRNLFCNLTEFPSPTIYEIPMMSKVKGTSLYNMYSSECKKNCVAPAISGKPFLRKLPTTISISVDFNSVK